MMQPLALFIFISDTSYLEQITASINALYKLQSRFVEYVFGRRLLKSEEICLTQHCKYGPRCLL